MSVNPACTLPKWPRPQAALCGILGTERRTQQAEMVRPHQWLALLVH